VDIVGALLKVALIGSAWVLYLLLLLSVLSFGVMAERAWFFTRNRGRGGNALRRRVFDALRQDDEVLVEKILRESGSVEGACVAGALVFRKGGRHAFGDALEAEVALAHKRLDRGMNYLGTLGSNAPFIGLFGTVIGVIGAFHELGSAAAKAGAMGGVMSGIAEALVATGVGIFVAIPAVAAYNIGQKWVSNIEADTLTLGRLVSAWMETHEKGEPLVLPPSSLPVSEPTPEPTNHVAEAVAAGE
jgi:biopolymer transport protein ExbB/biopolymer transport protein TolQ